MKRILNVALTILTITLVALVAWVIASRNGLVTPPPANITLTGQTHTPTSKGNKKHSLAYLSKDNESIKVDDLGPRKWKIVDIHEHAKSEVEAQQLLKAMDKFGIQRTALMASTTYTLTLNPIYGFEGFKENNEAIIAIKKKWPDRFSAFITFDPCAAEDPLPLVKDYVSRGADGVKLYLGHGATTPKFAFHCTRLDDPKLMPFYAWAEEVQLPILMHVNLEKYWDELLNVLEKHPHLRLTLPHFGLHKNTEQRLKRLGWLLDRYPFVFTDISFGYYTFHLDGFEVLAKFRTRSRDFMKRYRDRIMYASDMVLEPSKTDDYVVDTLRSYLQFLEQPAWRFYQVPTKTMHGMGLDDETLKHIYEVAPAHFLLLDDKGMSPDRSKDPKVVVERPVVPPLDPSTIPPLKAGASTGTTTGSPAPAGAKSNAPDDKDEGPDDDNKPNEGGCEHEDAATDDEHADDEHADHEHTERL